MPLDPHLPPAAMPPALPPTGLQGNPDYVWELATMNPAQGSWTEAQYLDLTDGSNRRIEFTNGRLVFLAMPTELHQELVAYLYRMLYEFVVERNLGKVHFSGLRLRIRPDRVREPDVVFLKQENFHVRHKRVWDGADLVMEVVSDDLKDRERDYKQKLADYAEGGVSEYWIVDYEKKQVLVHQLEGDKYVVRGTYTSEQQANSVLLEGFSVDVTALFAAAEDVPE